MKKDKFLEEYLEFIKYNNNIVKTIINKNFYFNQNKINLKKNIEQSKENLRKIRSYFNE